MSRACDLYVSNKFYARYRRAEYASSASQARPCTLHARFNFCFSSVLQACVGRALNVHCVSIARA